MALLNAYTALRKITRIVLSSKELIDFYFSFCFIQFTIRQCLKSIVFLDTDDISNFFASIFRLSIILIKFRDLIEIQINLLHGVTVTTWTSPPRIGCVWWVDVNLNGIENSNNIFKAKYVQIHFIFCIYEVV